MPEPFLKLKVWQLLFITWCVRFKTFTILLIKELKKRWLVSCCSPFGSWKSATGCRLESVQLRWRCRIPEHDALGSTVMALMDTGAHFAFSLAALR